MSAYLVSFYIPNQRQPLSHDLTASCLEVLFMPNETRPLSHGLTASFGLSVYTERNEAVNSRITAAFGLSLYTERNEAVKSWDNSSVWSSSLYRVKRGR